MSLQTLWDGIPAPIRTVLNVTVAGALGVVATAIYQKHGVSGVDWAAVKVDALDAAGLGFSTFVFRYVNPLDKVYGAGVSVGSPWTPDLVASADPAPVVADPPAPAPADGSAAFVPGATQ